MIEIVSGDEYKVELSDEAILWFLLHTDNFEIVKDDKRGQYLR